MIQHNWHLDVPRSKWTCGPLPMGVAAVQENRCPGCGTSISLEFLYRRDLVDSNAAVSTVLLDLAATEMTGAS